MGERQAQGALETSDEAFLWKGKDVGTNLREKYELGAPSWSGKQTRHRHTEVLIAH